MLRSFTLGLQLALLPLVFAFGLGYVVLHQHHGLGAQRARAEVIDLAGRQRALTHAVVRHTLMVDQGQPGDPDKLLGLLRKTAETLNTGGLIANTGGVEITIPPADPAAAATLQNQLQRLARLEQAVQDFRAAGEADRSRTLAKLTEAADAQFGAAQASVKAMVNSSDAALDRLDREAAIAGLIVLIASGILAFTVAAPIRRVASRLVRAMERVADGDLQPIESVPGKDELARLSAAVNRTLDQLRTNLGAEQVDWASYGAEQSDRLQSLVAMVDSSPIATLRFDRSGSVVYRNEAAIQFFSQRQVSLSEGSTTGVFAEAEMVLAPALRDASEAPAPVRLQCHGETLDGQVFRVSGDAVLTFRITTAEIEQQRQIEEAVVQSSTFARELAQVAEGLAVAVQDTAEISSRVALDTNEVSEGTSSVAAAAEEMNATVGELSTTAQEVAARVEESAHAAQRSTELMELLQSAGSEIGRVTDAISSIADQTNLLALNASIEAAGAGDAGRGFAVVASEVKDLARETMDSTASIAEQIESIRQRSSDAVMAVGEIGSALGGLRELAQTLAHGVEEQSATTSEISRSISDTAMRAGQIRGEICGLEASASESTETSQKVRSVADELESLAQRLTQADASH